MDTISRQNEQQRSSGGHLEKQQIAVMERDHLEKLTELLEQEQFELVGIPDGFTGHTADGTLRLIYLMNDAVESFLVLKEARMGGLYTSDYEGKLTYSLDREDGEYVLVVHQGDMVFTVFFTDIELDVQLYNYGIIGHFWVEENEHIRVLEYQIAILRDKYEYLGEEYCTKDEQRLSSLKYFPPLNYLFYPSVPEEYIVPMEDPWEVLPEAIEVMTELAAKAGDAAFVRALAAYEKRPTRRKAAGLAAMLRKSRHSAVVELLAERLHQAANVYPARDFGAEKNVGLHMLMEKAEAFRKDMSLQNAWVRVYKEEPFVYNCDTISFAVHVLTVIKGWPYQKVYIKTFASHLLS